MLYSMELPALFFGLKIPSSMVAITHLPHCQTGSSCRALFKESWRPGGTKEGPVFLHGLQLILMHSSLPCLMSTFPSGQHVLLTSGSTSRCKDRLIDCLTSSCNWMSQVSITMLRNMMVSLCVNWLDFSLKFFNQH